MRISALSLRSQKTKLAVVGLAGLTALGAITYARQGITAIPGPADTRIIQPAAGFADLVEAVRPAVVNISARNIETVGLSPFDQRRGSGPQNRFEFNGPPEMRQFMERFFNQPMPDQSQRRPESRSLGSGFIIDSSGLVVTNHHVIKGAQDIEVILDDGRTLEASVRGVDPRTDLALLEVHSEDPLPQVRFGDSDSARVGDWVIAIGNPFGLGGTTTSGIVSARGRDLRDGPYVDYIQIDAPINRGNSGGPLFNHEGEVIGINTAIFSPNGGSVGIGFAIPSAQAETVINQLRETGSVARSWLGVEIQPVTKELADGLGMSEPTGALISRISPNSPAERSELKPGDVILEFNQREVKKMRDLPRMVAQAQTGTDAAITVWRDGTQLDVTAQLEPMARTRQALASGNNAPEGVRLGLKLSNLNAADREAAGLDDAGVRIEAVDPAGAAAQEGLRAGDIILKVGPENVRTADDVIAAVRALQSEDTNRPVVLLVQRGDDRQFVAVRAG